MRNTATTDAATFSALEIRLDPAEVRRWLGYRRGRAPRPRVARRLAELWDEASGLLRPRGAFRVVAGERAAAGGVPRPTALVGVGVCTVGNALETEARRRGEAGEVLDALLFDAVGTAAAEAAADALNRELCAWAEPRGHYLAPRISPGYGRWDLGDQPALLALLPAARLGIRLTDAMMLVPHKSVSFAVRFTSRPPRRERRGHCRRCGLVDCRYRRSPSDSSDLSDLSDLSDSSDSSDLSDSAPTLADH